MLPGLRQRSETSYAEISHVTVTFSVPPAESMAPDRRGVLVAGFEPARAFAQRCERSPRLPVSPHQHRFSAANPGNHEGEDA